MDDRSISILGCGWLGLSLARHLVKLGFSVKGSCTERDKLSLLEQSKITSFLIEANPQVEGDNINDFFQSKILFLNIPFRRNLEDPAYYKSQIDAVIALVKKSPIKFVIFASSTSIYPESVAEALEDTVFEPENPRSKVLWDIEQMLLAQKEFQSTVIRFSGLYGGKRKIGRALAGRKGIPEGKAPVNLIHLEDCIGLVTRLIEKNIWSEIFNACSDKHPMREDIYTKAALHYGFLLPQFVDGSLSCKKIVSNAKIKHKLGYIFKHPDPSIF